jgi:hypothetical protein
MASGMASRVHGTDLLDKWAHSKMGVFASPRLAISDLQAMVYASARLPVAVRLFRYRNPAGSECQYPKLSLPQVNQPSGHNSPFDWSINVLMSTRSSSLSPWKINPAS